jgi:hypothetical protein
MNPEVVAKLDKVAYPSVVEALVYASVMLL